MWLPTWLVLSEGSRALTASETAAAAATVGFQAAVCDSTLAAVQSAVASKPHGVRLRIVICGSLYLAGEVLQANGTRAPEARVDAPAAMLSSL